MKFLSFDDVALGQGRVRAFTLFECKRLFSIIFYKWETIDQVRFHTHAFPSIAFLLWGSYAERRILNGAIDRRVVGRKFTPRWLPRNYCHSIVRHYGLTLSMVIAGPWQKTWWEWFPAHRGSEGWSESYWQEYGWGRRKIRKVSGGCELRPWDPETTDEDY